MEVYTTIIKVARRGGLVAAVSAFLFAGCAAPPKETVWVAPPRIGWADLSTTPVQPVENNFVILDDAPTTGRFPCALAVSRMATEKLDVQQEGPLNVPATPHNEFLLWNNSFDNLPAVSEAFPVVQRNLGENPADVKLVVSASRAFHAGLSLVYAVNQLAPEKYEMMGVLHDTESGKPIAALHTVNESIVRPPDAKKAHNNVDAWEYEARALARAQFKKLALMCFRELIAHDVPQRVDPPEGWIPDRPLAPVIWPPRYYQP